MMKTKLLFLALVVGVVGVGSAHAHHSFAATYFVTVTTPSGGASCGGSNDPACNASNVIFTG